MISDQLHYENMLEGFPIEEGSRVLVCGGRDFPDRGLVWAALRKVCPAFIVTGGQGKKRPNRGADLHAEKFAKEYLIPHDVVHADWEAFGRSAGPRRNSEMLIKHPDIQWAIGFPGGTGTDDMLKKALLANIKVVRFIQDPLDPTLYHFKPEFPRPRGV